MRSSSTVSGPLLSVSTPASQQNRFAAVHLLTGQSLYFIVEGKSRVKEVYAQLTTYMVSQGMQNIDLFALAFFLDDEYFFADPESKLSKYSPKSWKSSSTYGLDQNGQPLLQLHLRVKFYVDTTNFLSNDITRQHYYRQLRKNIADRGGSTEEGEHNVLPLVALGLQADIGDYTADTDLTSELLEQYLPAKVYKYNEHKVKQMICALYKGQRGLSKNRAQSMFIQEAGVIHKSHLYRLRLNKSQPKQTQSSALSICNSVWLAICTKGVQLFHENLTQPLSSMILWTKIMKLAFDRKKFELRPSEADRLVYYTNSDEKSKLLLALCRETHQFNMMIYPKLLEMVLNNNMTDKNVLDALKWTNENKSKLIDGNDTCVDEKKSENGGCSDSSNPAAEQETTNPKEKDSNGSISSSVELGYSHTAQNSTVSELDYSVQSAQDCSDVYLMYRHPRARAAYVDNSNQSAHTSSGVYTCASYSTTSKDMDASASYTTENCSSVDDSGAGDYKTTSSSTTASQSGALQLSAEPVDADSAYGQSLPPATIEASSTRADDDDEEEGSAAAVAEQQIAAVDDCDGGGGGGGGGDDDGTDELYDLSAAATSDSSYCVGGGATTATTASDVAPSKCGDDVGPYALDGGYADAGAEGGRSRSGSVVSNSGSFRGDGSDPSEGGRGALLSAAELSDLIVGRKSLQTPRKGFYPSRPTTSSTLDSDSDYVTLPPPMNFVTGAPSLSNLSLANFDCGTGTAAHWDVHRSFDLLSNGIKICNGHHHHLYHHHPHQCVVNSNNYLDVHKSGATFYHHIYPVNGGASAVPPSPPPPLLHVRQPPPPPPPPPPRPKRFDLQLEQYKQQLRSDVDFVVYPLQDPAVSRQEYAEAKSRRHQQQQQHQQYQRYYGRDPPSYRANAHLYRSTPNVAAAVSPPSLPSLSSLSASSTSSSSLSRQYHHLHHHHHHHHSQQQLLPPPLPPLPPHLKYASNQNLLFPADHAQHRHHRLQPLPLPVPVRTYSHDDLLAAVSSTAAAPAVPPKLQLFRRRPPPPPPPVTGLQKPAAVLRQRRASAAAAIAITTTCSPVPSASTAPASSAVLDIEALREQSRNLDLPLISALCNDQTLLKQTNALITENKATQTTNAVIKSSHATTTAVTAAITASSSSHQSLQSSSSVVEHQPPATGSGKKSNCTRCTNGTASYSSTPPPSFLSTAAASAAAAVATTAASPSTAGTGTGTAVKTAKSKIKHIKTNTNII